MDIDSRSSAFLELGAEALEALRRMGRYKNVCLVRTIHGLQVLML